MKNRRWCSVIAVLAVISSGVALAPAGDSPPAPDPKLQAAAAASELADRFEGLAYATSQTRKIYPSVLREMGALAMAASKLNPAEPRYLRLAAQSFLQAGDVDNAIDALKAYKKLVPYDEIAGCTRLDLEVRRMQTADAQLNYLHYVVATVAIDAPVRAHAAVLCAQTLMARSQQEEAAKMLDTATTINPLDRQALGMKYAMAKDEGPSRRVGLLLAMLRGSPADPEVVTALAGELADVGLVADSVEMYGLASGLYNALGVARNPAFARGAATELYLSNRPEDAAQLLNGYITSIPDDAEAWTIRLAIEQDIGKDPAVLTRLSHQAAAALTARFQTLRASIHAPNATTQPSVNPATSPSDAVAVPGIPDLSGDWALLKNDGRVQIQDAYIAAAEDVAWLRLYFLRDVGPENSRLLDALSKLLPADDPTLARLVGWKYLIEGRYPEARQKLMGISDRDPYAALGMVLLERAMGNPADADAKGNSAMAAHPSGAGAALLYSVLRLKGVKVIPIGQSAAVQAAMNTFPKEWLNILDHPQDFYVIYADVSAPTAAYGEAILATITIDNVSNFDILIGDDGVLRPGIVFDANARGLVQQAMPQMAYERLWQRRVLKSHQQLKQVVRMDRGELAGLLDSRPGVAIELSFDAVTNPLPTKKGFVKGPAGYSVQFNSLMERSGLQVNKPEDRAKFYSMITDAAPADRFSAIDAATAFAVFVSQGAQGNADTQAVAAEFMDHAQRALHDSDPSVRAWATLRIAIVTKDRTTVVPQMVVSEDWTTRLLGLVAARGMPDEGKAAALALSNDNEPVVRTYARAMVQFIADSAADTTRPAEPEAPANGK